METSSGGNLIVPTGFSARFRAFEPGFPRSSPAAQGKSSSISYPFIARIGKLHRVLAPSRHPAHHRREATLLMVLKGGHPNAFSVILLGSRISSGKGTDDAEQETGGAAHRRKAGAGACGFAWHVRLCYGDCDPRCEHQFRRRPG